VDTGASESVISRRLAEKLGLLYRWRSLMSLRQLIRRGLRICGEVYGWLGFQGVEVPGGTVLRLLKT